MRRSFGIYLVVFLTLASVAQGADWMVRPGTIAHAKTLSDGASVSLDAELVDQIVTTDYPAHLVIRECFDRNARIVVVAEPSSDLRPGQIVDVQGVMSTLADGQRAIISPSIYGYTDRYGNLLYHGPLVKGPSQPIPWDWKVDLTDGVGRMSGMMEGSEEPETLQSMAATSCSTIAELSYCLIILRFLCPASASPLPTPIVLS